MVLYYFIFRNDLSFYFLIKQIIISIKSSEETLKKMFKTVKYDSEHKVVKRIFGIISDVNVNSLPVIETEIMLKSLSFTKGLKQNCSVNSLIDKESPIFWKEISQQLQSDCMIYATYQHVYQKYGGPFAKLNGSCRKGNCNITVVLLDNPFLFGITRVKIIFRKDIHSHISEKRLYGKKRDIISRRAQHESSHLAFLEQFEKKGDYHSLEVIQKGRQELSMSSMTLIEYFNEMQVCKIIDNSQYMQSWNQIPFNLILYEEDQVLLACNLFSKSTWESPLVLSGDISGEIFYFPSNVLNTRTNCTGIFTLSITMLNAVAGIDIMLEKCRAIDISLSLQVWRESLSKVSRMEGIAEILVCDFSWPLLHGFLIGLLKTDIHQYLDKSYSDIMNGRQAKKGETIILIDLLHLVKIFLKQARKKSSKKIANKFVLVFFKILNCRTIQSVIELWTLIVQCFALPIRRTESEKRLEELCNDIDLLNIHENKKTDYICESESDSEGGEERKNGIRNRSKFKQFFDDLTEKVIAEGEMPIDLDQTNELHASELVKYFKDTYLPLLPLISMVAVPTCFKGKYPTSSSVELHFRNLKHTAFKNVPIKSRTPAVFLQKLRNWNSLKRKAICSGGNVCFPFSQYVLRNNIQAEFKIFQLCC